MVSILTSARLATLPMVSSAFAVFVADCIILAPTRSEVDSWLCRLNQLDRLGHLCPFVADLGHGHHVSSQRVQEDVFRAFLDLRPEGHLDGELCLLVPLLRFQHQMAFAPTGLEATFREFRADHDALDALLPEADRRVGYQHDNEK